LALIFIFILVEQVEVGDSLCFGVLPSLVK